jgi:hypothetical protein
MRKLLILTAVIVFTAGNINSQSFKSLGVIPDNSPEINRKLLQHAIDSLSVSGGSIFIDPSDKPYHISGGLILRQNVSLKGANAATPRGTCHPTEKHPVGSVIRITDTSEVFISVESATQISGIQFWYSDQSVKDPGKIISYPATIRLSYEKPAQGVTLRDLTFYGEYLAMDFAAPEKKPCELITIEHCFGYPLGGTFIKIDRCYDIPRILHCHVNPSINRLFAGGFSKAVVDRVVSMRSFAYVIDHTDNAQLIDVFTFGTWGGIYLGAETYGQLTNFNLDCVAVGIWKKGNNTFNRNWQIAQGAIIANTGEKVENIHPFVIEGLGHTAISNVEAFSGGNSALTTVGKSYDFLKVTGNEKCTISLSGCRMRNYISASPLTIENPKAIVQVTGCIDKDENILRY